MKTFDQLVDDLMLANPNLSRFTAENMADHLIEWGWVNRSL